jgi:hypothetical protein
MNEASADLATSVNSDSKVIWIRWAVPVAMAAVALVVSLTPSNDAGVSGSLEPAVNPDADYIGSRGGERTPVAAAAVGLTGVTETSQQQYEVTAPDTYLYSEDYLRISTTSLRADLDFVFVLGLQEGREPIWYEPDPSEGGTQSVPTVRGEVVPLGGLNDPFEFKVSGRHVVGELRVYALFSNTPIEQSVVAKALASKPPTVSAGEWLETALSASVSPLLVTSVRTEVRQGREEDAR